MAKTRIEFEGFDEVIARLSQLEGDVKGVTEQALQKTKQHIHKNLKIAMQRHNLTFATVNSLDESSRVNWQGSIGSIDVGFDISNGGLPSVFLMYGTPRMRKDQNLYNAIYGEKTKDDVMKIQEEILFNAIRNAGG